MNKIVTPPKALSKNGRLHGIRTMAGGVGIALVLALGGCGGGGDSVEKIANDACDLFKGAMGDGGDMTALASQMDELEEKSKDLEARAKALDLSDEEMGIAVEKACPEIAEIFSD